MWTACLTVGAGCAGRKFGLIAESRDGAHSKQLLRGSTTTVSKDRFHSICQKIWPTRLLSNSNWIRSSNESSRNRNLTPC
jgi:hypothetical protein